MCAQGTQAYFDIELIQKYLQSRDTLRPRALQHRLRRKLQDSGSGEADDVRQGETFWDRLTRGDKSAGQRAAITTMIAAACVVVVVLFCVCTPTCEMIFWSSRDDDALRETYEPQEKPPERALPPSDDMPAAAGDDVIMRRGSHV
eukprot:CAMPEP_0119416848 /NCGR_PEP_ID=MMETSP1335-20130426/14331_1 /TAXON_ID=259385 /ORGANISM="Chrysoculter rhomboideus, Strain RCC1486" /LENGTH=144 /DNA_ID=CAMNT_0007441993 /DNA_START=1 /DNA_END=435 /DNA_ORIENTATION=+